RDEDAEERRRLPNPARTQPKRSRRIARIGRKRNNTGAKPKVPNPKQLRNVRKKAETAAKKAEAKRLAEQEEKELEKALKKSDTKVSRVSALVPKVMEAELIRRREEERAALAKKSEEAKKKQTRVAAKEEYEKMVLVSNMNRGDSLIEARTVDEALAKMTVADNLPVDRHPEKRLKASFKMWKKSPD
ncbi:hypothetical protein HID58_072297, partial [Brassica napus]